MKNLYQFITFDLESFLSGKTLLVTALAPLLDYSSGLTIGTKVECVITADDTVYRPSKDGTTTSNLYEKITVKVKEPNSVNVAIGDFVEVINGSATVYGDYNNKLSVTADGLTVVKAGTTKGKN